MGLLHETVPDRHVWWRIARSDWANPLDPSFAQRDGGRWNPPESFPVLYLNEDIATAQGNLRAFIARCPYEPEDLREDRGPMLVGCVLPQRQVVCDIHSSAGLRAANLPDSYPLDEDGAPVPRTRCQPVGIRAKAAGLRGIRARSAQSQNGACRELAWFPASVHSIARRVERLGFTEWFEG